MVRGARVGAAAVLFALLFPTVAGVTGNTAVALLVSAVVSATVIATPTTERNGDAWEPVRPWQYAGQYIELGGLRREEQEEAIDEVRGKADDTEPVRQRDR